MLALIGPIFYVYAVILLLGGIYGYYKAKSAVSLVTGIMSAILAAVAAYLVTGSPRTAILLGSILAFALEIVFFLRYRATKNPMPALPLMGLSGAVIILGIIALASVHSVVR